MCSVDLDEFVATESTFSGHGSNFDVVNISARTELVTDRMFLNCDASGVVRSKCLILHELSVEADFVNPTLVYTYTPTPTAPPEPPSSVSRPAAGMLLLGGFGLLGLVARRRSQKRPS